MLEKSGRLLLSQEDIDLISVGIIPDRIKEWDLTLDELQALLASSEYTLIS